MDSAVEGTPTERVNRHYRSLGALREEDREKAVEALINLGEIAIGPLCAKLRDESWEIKPYLARILGELAKDSISPALRAALPRLRWERLKMRAFCSAKQELYREALALGDLRAQQELRKTQITLGWYNEAIAQIQAATVTVSELPLPVEALGGSSGQLPTPADRPASDS